jgi:hypothetical protein
MRRWLILLLIAPPAILRGQAPDQKPLAFEVASIKPSTRMAAIGQVSPDRFYRPSTTVLTLVIYGFVTHAATFHLYWTIRRRDYSPGLATIHQQGVALCRCVADS